MHTDHTIQGGGAGRAGKSGRIRRRAIGFAAVGAIVATMLGASPAAAAPFANAEPTVFLAQNQPTQLKSSVQGDGQLVFSNVGPVAGRTYNAIGYNEQDNFLYGVANDKFLIRIHGNGAIENVRAVEIVAHVGAFQGKSSIFWFSNGTALYRMDVSKPNVAPTLVTPKPGFPAPDFTWSGGYFWGLTGGSISRMSTDGTVTTFPAPPRLATYGAGGAWTYGNGNLGFTDNTTGDISQVRVTNPASASPTFTVVSVISGPPSGNNDAAASMGRPADLALTKSFAKERVLAGGDGSFDLTVVNNGAGISSGYTVTDAVPANLVDLVLPQGCALAGTALTCSGGRLAVGQSATFRIGAKVQSGTSSGTITNTASVLGNEEDSVPANNTATDSLIVERSALTIVKTAELVDDNENGVPDVGERVDYSFVVTNAGTTAMTDVTVADPRVSSVSPASANLPPGGSVRFTASYVITQDDIDAGGISNTATATGVDDFGGTVTSPPSTAFVEAPADPGLQAVKTAALNDANGNGAADEGETIAYEVTVTNIGNVVLSGVSVDDPLLPLSPASADLAPAESARFTGEYTVTAADVAAGSVNNTATATGSTPGGGETSSPPTSTTTPAAAPSLTVVKSAEFSDANGNGLLDEGEEITYSFVVTNDGNVHVEDVTIDDPQVTGLRPASADIPAGEQVIFTADPYVVTTSDVENGSVVNTAAATGTPVGGEPLTTPPSTVTVPTVDPVAQWELEKLADLDDVNGNGRADVGETINYSFLATNTGTLTVTDVSVSDPRVSGITPASATLIPGQRITFASDPYTVTQADVDAGTVHNEATGSANGPGGPITTPPAENDVPTVPAAPGIRTVKNAVLNDANGNGVADEGEQIQYEIVVTNTGNVTLSDVTVDDPKAGALTPAVVERLAPKASARFTAAPYTVTAADVLSGSVDNTATATATPPTGDPVTGSDSTTTETVAPGLEVLKSATLDDVNGNDLADRGEIITYTFVVTNTGNTRLEDISIDDPRVSAVSPASADIDVNSSQRFTAEYEVTEADIIAGGQIANTATAKGTVPGGGEITSPPSTATVPPAPVETGLVIEKLSRLDDGNGNGVADLGETIEYTFVVSNTGNVTISDARVQDDRVTGLDRATATIPPGASAVFAADPYTVTQADIDAGTVLNEATASGTGPDGGTVPSEPATNEVPVPDPAGAMIAEKSAALDDVNGNGVADEGETIAYSITLTNTGNVTLSDVSANDPMLSGLTPEAVEALAPGESATFTAEPYTVTAGDVDAGVIVNTATGTARTPGDEPIESPEDSVSTPTFDPGMLVEKSAELDDANGNDMADLGETIEYTFTVTNTGNVRIDDLTIDDPRVAGVSPASASVEPGESLVFTAEAYRVSEEDILAGTIENTATAGGTPDGGEPITTPPSVVTVPPAPVSADLDVAKKAAIDDSNGNGVADEGERIEYTITVTNTGNVTIRDLRISDPKLRNLTPDSVETLAPGASVTATADPYVVTAADIATGAVKNIASASGLDPNGDPVDAESPEVSTPTGGGLAVTGATPPWMLIGFAALTMLVGAGVFLAARREQANEA